MARRCGAKCSPRRETTPACRGRQAGYGTSVPAILPLFIFLAVAYLRAGDLGRDAPAVPFILFFFFCMLVLHELYGLVVASTFNHQPPPHRYGGEDDEVIRFMAPTTPSKVRAAHQRDVALVCAAYSCLCMHADVRLIRPMMPILLASCPASGIAVGLTVVLRPSRGRRATMKLLALMGLAPHWMGVCRYCKDLFSSAWRARRDRLEARVSISLPEPSSRFRDRVRPSRRRRA
jgi:hypothetical protein